MIEVVKKKFDIRKILKDVVEKSLNEADDIMKQDDSTEEKIPKLNSYKRPQRLSIFKTVRFSTY